MKYFIEDTTLTEIADGVRTLSGTTDDMSTGAMIDAINTENDNFNTNLASQNDLIGQIKTALEGKSNPSSTPSLQDKTITPTAEQQIVMADSDYDGLSKVTITGDSNLVPENIASGKTIFGVTGSYEGSGETSSTVISITITDWDGQSFGWFDETGSFVYSSVGSNTFRVKDGIVYFLCNTGASYPDVTIGYQLTEWENIMFGLTLLVFKFENDGGTIEY